jgi:hypothetical protein
MDMRKFSGEQFMKVDDVRDGPLQVQIAVVKEGKFDKSNVIFESGEFLSVNATTTRILVRAYGPNSDDWIGKEIELTLGTVEFQKKPQDAVIIKPISPPIAITKKAAAAAKFDDFDDEIPL